MAYLLGLAPSTFRQYVSTGMVPRPVKIGNKRRWHRALVVEAIAERSSDNPNEPSQGILEAAYGKTKGARRNVA